MCCEKVTKALDELGWKQDDEQLEETRGAVFRLVTTCYGDCSKTVTEGLRALLDEQKTKEQETGRALHATVLVAILSRHEEEISKRRAALMVARKILGAEYEADFIKIENQLK